MIAEKKLDFQHFLSDQMPVFLDEMNKALDAAPGLSDEDKHNIHIYMGEALFALDIILPYLEPGSKVLEIGSGIGVLGIFLARHELNVQGIDSAGDGFDVMPKLAALIRNLMDKNGLFQCHDKSCEDLDPKTDGTFDLIFSVHVLEHIPDIDKAISAMANSLKSGGEMIHLCPNYRCPYEPHFSIPIFLWSPRLTYFFYKERIQTRQSLWESINFLTAGDINRLAKRHNLNVLFRREIMSLFLKRLLTDTLFADRHQSFIGKLAVEITQSPLFRLLTYIPPRWATPMLVILKKPFP